MRFMTVLPSRPDAGGGILTRRMGRAEGGFQRRNWSTHPPGPLRTGYKPITGLHGDGFRCALPILRAYSARTAAPTAFGACVATLSTAFAAPLGSRRPCSRSCTVPTATPSLHRQSVIMDTRLSVHVDLGVGRNI